jgi:hypothetical protein
MDRGSERYYLDLDVPKWINFCPTCFPKGKIRAVEIQKVTTSVKGFLNATGEKKRKLKDLSLGKSNR